MDYTIRLASQLGDILKAFRTSQGLSQSETAQRIGISQQAYSLLENAPQRASFERLLRVCSTLGIEVVLREKRKSLPVEQREW